MSEEFVNGRGPGDSTPEENGGGARMFTQEEVNRIVSERLTRERERAAQQPPDPARESALKARESRMDCREYLAGKGYPEAFLEALDTADVEKFKAAVDKLMSPGALFAMRGASTARPPCTVPGEPDLAAAFRPPEYGKEA